VRSLERHAAVIMNALLLLIVAALLVYLVYALLRPEKF
jgi:K+-transporting ATPase KdpF subunit